MQTRITPISVNFYAVTYHRTIKMNPVDVKSNTYIDSSKEINDKDLKSKIGDIIRISKYKNIFAKGYVPNWSAEVFVIANSYYKVIKIIITKLKILFRGHLLIVILNMKKLLDCFTKRKCKKINQKEFRVEKVTKRKDYKLYVKWKGCNSSFNSWIDRKDIIWMSKCFPEPKFFPRKVDLDWFL